MAESYALLLSALGAGILGFGLGVLFAGYAAGAAPLIIVLGIIMHSIGMYLTHTKEEPRWARISSWICWLLLIGILAYLLVKRF